VGIAQHGAAHFHARGVAFAIIHGQPRAQRRSSRS
jgi:hypothetical protein